MSTGMILAQPSVVLSIPFVKGWDTYVSIFIEAPHKSWFVTMDFVPSEQTSELTIIM